MGAAARAEYLKVPADQITRLAAFLAFYGEPESTDSQQVFWAFKSLLFHDRRVNKWDAVMLALPATREAIAHVAACCNIYSRQVGAESFSKAKFALDEVVKVMLQIKDPASYIPYVMRSELKKVSAVFHPNTLAYTAQRLRGTEGELSSMAKKVTEHAISRMKVTRA